MVSPLGLTVDESWQACLAGKSGIAPVSHFDVSAFSVRIGGSVKGFHVTDYINAKDAKKMDAFIHYGVAAGTEAIKDAGLQVNDENSHRIGVAIGSGIGGVPGIERGYDAYLKGGPRKISPFFVPANIINMISGHLSIMFGLRGPNIAVVTACTTGTHNIGESARMIEYGDADVMVAGGAEMATSATGLGGFASARALSTRNDEPEKASRPFDVDRDGFVLSDGAGVMVLEEYECAKKRGARIYAELSGYGVSGDAYHMTAPPENGEGAARCMENAIRNAGLNVQDVQYINAHGTSTKVGDIAETRAIKSVFGSHADRVVVSSTKSMTGHMLGATGAVEAIFSVLAIRDKVIPPTINLENPDPQCDLDYTPEGAREMPVRHAMSNSFGFGGTNASLVFSRIE